MSKEVKRWNELKALAEGMDGWPNKNAFEFDDAWCVGAIDEDENLWPVIEIQTEQYDAFDAAEPMAKYYAAANPTAILKLLAEREALLAERDAEWISAETLPACPDAEITFEAKEYLVTNGYTVGICDFQRGHGCGQPWAAWGNYGSLKPSEITHWKPLPVPPALQGEQP